jgi:predicted permease
VIVVACCAFPARVAARTDATTAFATRVGTRATRARGRDWLVAMQIGGALVLLIGAVLFARSFVRAQREDPGYPAERLVVARIDLPRERYRDVAAVSSFFREAATRIDALPGVEAVGGITDFFIRRNADQWVTVRGRPASREPGSPRLAIEGVTPGFFRSTAIELLEGRDFEPADYAPDAAGVCIVSESLARRFWPGGDAIGQQLVSGETPPKDGRWRTVIGVVRDIRRESLDLAPILGAYVPAFPRGMDLTVRASTRADTLIPAIRQQLRLIDSALPFTRITAASGRLAERLDGRRFESQALAAFSVVALLLSATGLYSTLAYQVVLRRREIGIRAALGADRPALVRMVLAGALRVAAAGTLVGVLVAAWAATAMRSLLYQTMPVGVLDYGAAAAFTLAVVVVAASLPAWRASRVDPTMALRTD